MRAIYVLIMWHLGYKGNPCKKCGFYRAAHYDTDLQFDIDNFACRIFESI